MADTGTVGITPQQLAQLLQGQASSDAPGTTTNSTTFDFSSLLSQHEQTMPVQISGLAAPNVPGGVGPPMTYEPQSAVPGGVGPPMPYGGPTTTMGAAVVNFARADPDQIEQVQRALFDAHYYPSSMYSKGVQPDYGNLTQEDMKAYIKALRDAQRRGDSLNTVIDNAIDAHGGPGNAVDMTGQKAKEVHVMNPDDVAGLANHTAQSVFGRDLTPQEMQQVVSTWQGREQTAGQAGGPGQTVQEAPSGAEGMETLLKSMNPVESQANTMAGAGDIVLRAIMHGIEGIA